ncbi:PH domain-containing protein [Leucobacter luti]|uniref:PH domain-containing protein n=1 Tax=Leucobacter luti TaxID=340320 RepID=UPI003CFBE44F
MTIDPGAAPGEARPDPDPAPAAGLPGTADAEGWRRLHPLSPVLRGGLAFIIVIGVIVANMRDWLVRIFVTDRVEGPMGGSSDEGDPVSFVVEHGWVLPAMGIAIVVILLIVLFSWIAWRFQTYRVTGDAVEARTGVLFRQHRRAPLERIQSVNLQRPLLARVVGLTKIEVVTAGQGGKVELAYLGHRDAKTVREQILGAAAMKRDGGSAEAVAESLAGHGPTDLTGIAYQGEGDALTERSRDFIDTDIDPHAAGAGTLVRVPLGRLVGSILLSWETITIVLMIVIFLLGSTITTLLMGFRSGSDFLNAGVGAALGFLFGIVPLILVFLGVLFGQFNKGFNFVLSRGREGIRVGSGLTSTTTETIPFGRIHAVEARQPLLWRPFKWWRIRVTTAGHSAAQAGQNQVQNVVLPVGREEDVLRVIETLLPGVGDEAEEIASLRDGLTGDAAGYLRAGPRAAAVLLWGKRRAGLEIADPERETATLRVRRGYLTRSLSVMPILRAQSAQLRRPLVHRMLGLASVQAHTVLGPVRMEMRGIELGAAHTAFDALSATILRVQGAEAAGRADRAAHRSAPTFAADQAPAPDPGPDLEPGPAPDPGPPAGPGAGQAPR